MCRPHALAERKALLLQKEEEAVKALREAAQAGDKPLAQLHLERLLAFADLRRLVEEGEQGGEQKPTYLVGSLFLYDAYKALMCGENEQMHYVTGVRWGNILTLERLVPFHLEKATPVFAKGDALSSHAALVHLDRFGYCLHALFHRHPGQGKEASRPSYIDLETQERLERGKYPVIGAIFTRDGWVRFFSVHNPFQVITYGERLERDEGNLLRLTHLSEG